ncbi:DUF262 domain-containing protein [Lactiplantibacillus modestisalitolerans]|uniref:DUF262 domain-containing protein n=1 Tax=Lactiplantibacillus modestisalitolerans TaxID=1457219 RepID=A0ABV5WQX8_9LACO|nr:DUF262 domain-containing protein [Lactiplantibacillus modestisalitolerans]
MATLVQIPTPSSYKIENLFRDNNFVVPLYQRNYAWGTNEVGDFWRDLQDIIDGRRNSHFFGQIVTFKNDQGDQEIIDGQQRLTTSIIFMAAIRDMAVSLEKSLKEAPDTDFNEEISDTLRNISYQVRKAIRGNGEEQPALTVQKVQDKDSDETLNEFFVKLTHSRIAPTIKLASKPKNNMVHAYNQMSKAIQKALKEWKTLGERIDYLQAIFDAFFDHFYIVMLSAPSRQDAFTIFETLNSRGKDLTASDIIKNHLMSLMGQDLDEANQTWNDITEPLDNDSKQITSFIRTYWAAQHRIVPEARLYREISDKVDNPATAKIFLKELKELVELYTVLRSPLTPKAHYLFFHNERLTQQIDILNRMHVVLYYPILLALKHRGFSETDMLKVAQKVIAIFVRHRTIMNRGTNTLESGFSDIAHQIWALNLQNVGAITTYMTDHLLPSDDQTKTSFEAMSRDGGSRGAKKWTLVYLLSALYETDFDDFDNDDLYQRVFDDDNYQLVQISDDAEIADHQTYLGNWTILEKNLARANFKQPELRAALEKSNLHANQALARQLASAPWDDDAIKQRQSAFKDAVVLLW